MHARNLAISFAPSLLGVNDNPTPVTFDAAGAQMVALETIIKNCFSIFVSGFLPG